MKEYNLTKETLDATLEEVLNDLNEMLKDKPINTVKYGSGKIEEVKELTFSLTSIPQNELMVVVQLVCETGNLVFYLNIGLRSHAIDLGEELTAAFFEYSPILIELAKLKKEAEKEALKLKYEKAEKERAEKLAAEKTAKEEVKFLAKQKKVIEELDRAIGQKKIAQEDFYTDLGWITKNIGTINAQIPDFAESWFVRHFGADAPKNVIDSKKKTSGGFAMKWKPSFSISFKNIKTAPVSIQKKLTGKSKINDTEFVFNLIENYNFKFGKVQNVDAIIEALPADKVDKFKLGLVA